MIIRGTVLTGISEHSIIADGYIYIVDNSIMAVGDYRMMKDNPLVSRDDVIHFPYHWIMPGLVNGHVHSAMSLFRGQVDRASSTSEWLAHIMPLEAALTASMVEQGAMIGMREMVDRGITTIADMYIFPHAIARAAEAVGMRALVGAHISYEHTIACADMFVADWKDKSNRITPVYAPHTIRALKEDGLCNVLRRAQECDVPVMMHLAEESVEREYVYSMYGSYAALLKRILLPDVPVIMAHAVHMATEDISALDAYRVGVVHCPTSNARLAVGIAPIHEYVLKDIPLGIGTDGPASNNRLSIIHEIAMASNMQGLYAPAISHRLSAFELCMHATREGARAIHMDHLVGTLEPGKKADIIMIRNDTVHQYPAKDPWSTLVFATEDADITDVMIDGIWKKRAGKLVEI